MTDVGVRSVGFRRVLVLDDHEPSRIVMSYWLEMRGYACLTAANAADALAAFEDFAPDVVIFTSDPRRSSVGELAARFRALAEASPRHLQLIAVSVFNEDINDGRSEMIDAYLVKPIDMRVLVRLLETAVHT